MSKLLERFMYNKILDLLLPTRVACGLFNNNNNSTQLLTVLANINNTLDTRTQTDIIYFNLSKTFDSVQHLPLLHKLKTFGIHGQLHACFSSNIYTDTNGW